MNKPSIAWKIVQLIVWLIGIGILFCLIFYPIIGLHLLWNILIPIAPALIVVATGLWRNICPIASTALFPRYVNLSTQVKLTQQQQALLYFVAILLLYFIVPLRHILFNTSGIASSILLISIGIVALLMGSLFDWKSGWCSSLCPIHPVEKLYGTRPIITLKNGHCTSCVKCTIPCPDTTPNIHPFLSHKFNFQKMGNYLLVGGFPGFIWGWLHVADYAGVITLQNLVVAYKLPMIGLLTTFLLFYVGIKALKNQKKQSFIRIYVAAAISCYYWFRLPSLFGFGLFKGDGMLVDLSSYFSETTMIGITIITSLFFFWWLGLKKQIKHSWLSRPAYI